LTDNFDAQVGRVSPRKYSDRRDKQSLSPLSPEDTADNKSPIQPACAQASAGVPFAALKPKRESAGSPRQGTMPPQIEEGQEPPHDSILPA
jgi:hypothetical protein